MRSETRDRYHQRIDRVVGLINQKLEANPSLDDLATAAGISPYHFHRVYRAITGETPAGTLRRLRIAKGLILLSQSSRPITDIAFEIGYDSSQAFAKALREVTGYSASELRDQPDVLGRVLEELSKPPPQDLAQDLQVRLETVEPFRVIATRHEGEHGELFGTYTRLMEWAQQSGQIEGFRGIYGFPIDDIRMVPAEECRFDAAFDLGPAARPGPGHHEVAVSGGLYAVARLMGPYEGLEAIYDALYGAWLPESGYRLRDAPMHNHYVTDPEETPPEQWETDVRIPVEKVED